MFGLLRYRDATVIGRLGEVRWRFGRVATLEALLGKDGDPFILYTERTPLLGLSRVWFDLDKPGRNTLSTFLARKSYERRVLCRFGGWGDQLHLDAAVVDGALQMWYVRKRFPWPRTTVEFGIGEAEESHLRRLLK